MGLSLFASWRLGEPISGRAAAGSDGDGSAMRTLRANPFRYYRPQRNGSRQDAGFIRLISLEHMPARINYVVLCERVDEQSLALLPLKSVSHRPVLHQLQADFAPNRASGLLERGERYAVVLGIEQTIQSGAAGVHSLGHFSLRYILFLHRGFDLPRQNALDGGRGCLLVDALLAEPTIEGRS